MTQKERIEQIDTRQNSFIASVNQYFLILACLQVLTLFCLLVPMKGCTQDRPDKPPITQTDPLEQWAARQAKSLDETLRQKITAALTSALGNPGDPYEIREQFKEEMGELWMSHPFRPTLEAALQKSRYDMNNKNELREAFNILLKNWRMT
jgi:hypothetical protein